ncbi:MAG: sulfite exporter TauE/SafE family protein [Armatimonadetes bacterium]|nr:sulfite exporter TauE/SafE family protein [Armatimonadota bacterium]
MLTAFLTGLIAGLLNTPHCLGMCGGFPLHLAKSSRQGKAVLRQLLFVTGKTFTYIFLGALAGALGVVLLKDSAVAPLAPVLRTAAGVVTILFGLLMMGFRLPSIKALQRISEAGFVRSLFGGLFTNVHPTAALTLGVGVGFLPCPLPMGMLAVAAVSHNVLQGMALMAGVGVGTAPGLLGAGLFGVSLDRRFAKVGMRAAGVALLVIGLMTLGKVAGIIPAAHPGSGEMCH